MVIGLCARVSQLCYMSYIEYDEGFICLTQNFAEPFL